MKSSANNIVKNMKNVSIKNKSIFLGLIILTLFSCNNSSQKGQVATEEKNDSLYASNLIQEKDSLITQQELNCGEYELKSPPPPPPRNIEPKLGWKSYFWEEDSLITQYPLGFVGKKILINDSSYIWVFEKNEQRIVVDTVLDGQPPFYGRYSIKWMTDDMLCIGTGCGTYCWADIVYEFKNPPVESIYSYSAIDTLCMNVLEIQGDEFKITNLITKDTLVVKNNYFKFREDGYPLFFTNIISFSDSLIVYEVWKNTDETIRDEIRIEKFPCVKSNNFILFNFELIMKNF